MKLLSRSQSYKNYPDLPLVDEEKELYKFPRAITNYVLAISGDNKKVSVRDFFLRVFEIMETLQIEKLINLPECKTKWLNHKDKRVRFQKAVAYLQTNGVTDNFEGGIVVTKDEWKPFFKAVYEMTCLNASFPIIYFIDEHSTIIGNVCQYNHLHLSTLNDSSDKKVRKYLRNGGLVRIRDQNVS